MGRAASVIADEELRGRKLGEFVLRERIGEGGFGAVYRCEQPGLGREAVIKVLHRTLRHSDVVVQRFTREAQLASRLDHPYAAHIYAFGAEEDDGLFWIAMEMVQGTTLSRWLDDSGPLPLDELVGLFERIAEVVATAHERGIVHRDLKPSNIMIIERAGRLLPKLLDFGVAKLLGETLATPSGAPTPPPMPAVRIPDVPLPAGGGTLTADHTQPERAAPRTPSTDPFGQLTHTGAALGSPAYMAPEQWIDAPNVGPRADLYALAIVAYEALTGRKPFLADSMGEYADLHCHAEVPRLGDGFSPRLDAFFRRALAKDPAARWGTALELAANLRAAAQRAPDARAAKSRWPLALGAGVALAAAGVAFAILRFGGSDTPQEPPTAPAVAPVAQVDAAVVAHAPASLDAAASPAMVALQIESTPVGAEVFRVPSDVKVGTTPWHSAIAATDGVAQFVVKKSGYASERVELDLRVGGTQHVRLRSLAGTSNATTSPHDKQKRRKGEPVNPFSGSGS